MISYLEYLNMPTKVAIAIVSVFFIIQIIGELLEFKGKVVPEWVKIRKYFSRRKHEREILRQLPEALADVRSTLNEFMSHYSTDNIHMRNDWMDSVNNRLRENEDSIKEFDKKLDKNNADTLSLLIESKRSIIINFAENVIDTNKPVTKEQFKRVFRLCKEYEEMIEENNLVNGEIDVAHRIISESYEEHMRNHTFIEDCRGY